VTSSRPPGARTPEAALPFDQHAIRTLGDAVVGRQREIELLVAALGAGAHVLLEGPPGTGKSTLLRAVADAVEVPFTFVEGNAELTPARLVGHFDPALVLAEGYRPEVFVDGPLVEALRRGGLLYVEEINRIPEETLNLLVTVMSEGDLHVPRLGRVEAAPGFRLVAAMNPFDAVGTARISSAIYDRVCRLTMGYQDRAEEEQITDRAVPGAPPAWQRRVVELVRRTRVHPDVRVGSSVRGSIDLVRLATQLAALRSVAVDDWDTGLDAALVALSGRLRMDDTAGGGPERVIRDLYEEVFGPRPGGDDGTDGSDGADGSDDADDRSDAGKG
jgi:MoxR-like ATPase